ncbi:MAG: NAD(P)H-dependent oxidoreductase [Pseudomonadota bacterium]
MSSTKIAVIVGSIRQDSLNRKLALALAAMGPGDFTFEHSRLDDLPPFNQDHEKTPGEAVNRFKGEISAADGLLFVTPEYNRSMPGLLKNAIDHGSRPYGQSVWAGKPAGVIGISGGAIGTALAQQHLRNVLAYLDVPTLGQPEAFIQNKEGLLDDKGHIGIEASEKFLRTWMEKYAAFVKLHVGK